ncbi:MAG: hypothetical protein NUW01_10910 [Gemmatimonadaceae bacterium]|nr:hypothetical protein [Gemmatimonadaceae bacterium]
MRKVVLAAALLAVATVAGCKKTGEGEFEVERPVVGTVTDTINTPSIGMDTATVTVPTIGTDTQQIKVPTVNPPKP